MSTIIDGCKYYRTAEVCALAGISKSTILRWLASGIVQMPRRDRRGWRMFGEDELKQIVSEATRLE